MIRILIIVIAVILLAILINFYMKSDVNKRKAILKTVLFTLLLIALVGLVVAGRLNWMAAVFGSLIPLLPKVLGWVLRNFNSIAPIVSRFHLYKQNKKDNKVHGQQSKVNTDYLTMILDHDTGSMDGRVIKGEFEGRMISDLSLQEIRILINDCSDEETVSLLMAYLDRYHRRSADEDMYKSHNQEMPEFMSIHEAREILGVSEKAGKDEIISAHRQLIQKLHPDRGGSDYLSVKVNRAKEVLLAAL